MTQAIATHITAAPRFIPVIGDAMEPALPNGSYAAVVPLDAYHGEGIYAVTLLEGAVEFLRVQANMRGGFVASRDNGRTGPETLTASQFGAMVLGKVAAQCLMMDRGLLPGMA